MGGLAIERLQGVAEAVARAGAYVGCSMLLLAAGLIGIEVVARKFFQFSLGGADELASYALAIGMAWGYSSALFDRAHIRVDALYLRLPLSLRAVLDVVSLLAFAVFIGLLSYRALNVLQNTLEMNSRANTPLSTPLVIPQSLWLAGIVFFFLSLVILLARTSSALFSRDFATVQELAGAPSIETEVDTAMIELGPDAGEGKGD